ncbi:MAG: hypothetical protein ABI867_39650 [Kofleriaceae bacterium]
MNPRFAIATAVAWTGVTIGLFLWLFGMADTDDYAGWIIVVYGIQLPAFIGVVTARGARLDTIRAVALAIPAAVMCVIAVLLAVAVALPRRSFLDSGGTLQALIFFAIAFIALPVVAMVLTRGATQRSIPRALTRLLLYVIATDGLCIGAFVLAGSPLDAAFWLIMLTPVWWTIPFWAVHARRSSELATARVL